MTDSRSSSPAAYPRRTRSRPEPSTVTRGEAGRRCNLSSYLRRYGVREPGRLDQRLGHRIQHGGGIAGLMRVHRDHHIVAQGFLLAIGVSLLARRAMQLLAGQTTLEPQPHRVSRAARGAVREPEHQMATGSRFASEPARSAPEDPRSSGSRPRSKQVADLARFRFGPPGWLPAHRWASSVRRRADIPHRGMSAECAGVTQQ
jgi:hypothetical protein